jgi:NAD(P)-dependent dehydrogenase (short-subunit alcohol dehydrogenase family)
MGEMGLDGRVAVVTGASRGIGADIARRFAERGLRLGLCARSSPVLEDGPEVVARSLDVADEAALQAFGDAVVERFGRIDLWINNAGVLAPIAPVRDIAAAAFREHVDVNLVGAFNGTRCFIRHVRSRPGGGVLINVSSGAATNPYEGWGPYCAGKAGLEMLTAVVAMEEASAGLRAHSVAPGVVDTDMQTLIRESSQANFPRVERFRQRKREGAFNSGRYVADEYLAIAFDPARANEPVAIRIADER